MVANKETLEKLKNSKIYITSKSGMIKIKKQIEIFISNTFTQ